MDGCSYVQPPQKVLSLEDTVKLVDEVTKDLSHGCYASIQPSILRLSSNLKQHGPSLELQHTSHLDRLQLVLRPACRDQKLDLVSRVLLLEMIELRTFDWAPSQHICNYYKVKLQQINSEMLAGGRHSQSAQDYSTHHDFQSAPGPLRHSNVKALGFRPGTSHLLMNIPNRPASPNHLMNIPNRPAVPNYPNKYDDPPNSRLFVVVPKSLKEHFDQFGDVDYVSIVKDRTTKEAKGFGYVKYHRMSHATKAFEGCDRSYKPVFADPKPQKMDPAYCSAKLPPPQPLAPTDARVEERLFVVCTPRPPAIYALKDVFGRFGNLIDIYMLNNKTCGYAKYASNDSAVRAVEALHQQEVCGARLKVMTAEPRDNDNDSRKRPKMMDQD